MTTAWREVVPCPKCGNLVSTEPPIKAWIRTHKDLDSVGQCLCIGDCDLWVQRYGTRQTRTRGVDRDVQYLMLIEIKTHGKDLETPQRDLLHTVNQLLRTKPWKERRDNGRFVPGHSQNQRSVYSVMAGKVVQVLCYGVHKWILSGTVVSDSEWMTWDDKPIDDDQLIQLLRFDLSPDTLRPMEHRVHKRVNDLPLLFPAD